MKLDVCSLVTAKMNYRMKSNICGILTGEYSIWQGKKKRLNLLVDRIAEKLNLDFTYKAEIKGLHPGRTAIVSLEGKEIGFVGELHPQLD